MRLLFIIIGIAFFSLDTYSQAIPNKETTFNIQKKDKQQFEFFLQKGYTLKAIVKQMGIDLSISVYKKGDTARLAYFDSPNGEYGPEKIQFESKADANYTLLVEPLADDTAREGKYSIRQINLSKYFNLQTIVHLSCRWLSYYIRSSDFITNRKSYKSGHVMGLSEILSSGHRRGRL